MENAERTSVDKPRSGRDTAREMIDRGFAPTPVISGTKKGKLEEWPDSRITREEVNEVFAPEDSIGLLLGAPSGGLVDVDLDCEEAVALSSFLPATDMIHGRTGRPRSHLWYTSPQIKKRKPFKDENGKMICEIRAGRHLTVIPDSIHPEGGIYYWERDGDPGIVDDGDLINSVSSLAAAVILLRQYPNKGQRHDFTLDLAGALYEAEFPEAEAVNFIRLLSEAANDEESEAREVNVRSTYERKRNGSPTTGWIQLSEGLEDGVTRILSEYLGLGRVERVDAQTNSDSKKQTEERNPIARFERLVDLVEDNGKIKFLILDDDSKPKVVSEYERPEGGLWVPPGKQYVPFDVIPRAEGVLSSWDGQLSLLDPGLHGEMREFIRKAALPPEPVEEWLDLLAVWAFHTYVYEFFHHSPYLCFFAVPERGKSRIGTALSYLSYRGKLTSVPREAHLIRLAENFGATLFIDVKDLQREVNKVSGLEDVLLLRYERGKTLDRIVAPEKGPFHDTKYYQVYGPTIIATNEPVHRILDTRCLSVSMPEARSLTWGDPPEPKDALDLRERLTAWRAALLAKSFIDGEGVFPKVEKAAKARLGDITKPLLQISELVCPDRTPGIVALIGDLETQRRDDNAESWEGDIFEAIVDLEHLVRNGRLPLKEVTERVNVGRNQGFQLAPQKVGTIVKSFGFRTKKIGGRSEIVYDIKLIDDLADRFGSRWESGESPGTLPLNSPVLVGVGGFVESSSGYLEEEDPFSGVQPN